MKRYGHHSTATHNAHINHNHNANNNPNISKANKTTHHHQSYFAKPAIKDLDATNAFGILLMNQEDIQAIREKSGPLSSQNEYQVHYRALRGRIKLPRDTQNPEQTSFDYLDIEIPVTYYNYKQEVSSGSVEFHLNDIEEVSEQLTELSQALIGNMFQEGQLAYNIQALFQEHHIDIEWTNGGLSNIHKHPGKMHSFSGTDYRKNKDNPGICFPLSEGNKEAVFSSIITHSGKFTELGHTEYRIADGNIEDQITYFQGKCITIVKEFTPEPNLSPMQQLLGMEPDTYESYVVENGLKQSMSFIDKIKNIFLSSDYSAFTDMILPENVSEKTIWQNNHWYNQNKASNKTNKANNKSSNTPSVYNENLYSQNDTDLSRTKEVLHHNTRFPKQKIKSVDDIVFHEAKTKTGYSLEDIIQFKEELIESGEHSEQKLKYMSYETIIAIYDTFVTQEDYYSFGY